MSWPYQRIFREHKGEGPWPCEFCDEQVLEMRRGYAVVHHRDHDKNNNDPSNLVAAHTPCHSRHHLVGVPRTDEVRERIAVGKTGVEFSDEHRANLSEAQKVGQADRARDAAGRYA